MNRSIVPLFAFAERSMQALLLCCLCFGFGAWAAEPPSVPSRVVTEYALTSAYSRELADPQDWRLLASNDGGKNWVVLDVQTNQTFRTRSERRVFRIRNATAYSLYRLEVNHESAVQLAELELLGPVRGVAQETELRCTIRSSREHPLMGPAVQAFDHDPETRWFGFASGPSNTCWIECEYGLTSETPVTNNSQVVVLARRAATANPYGAKAPQILSNLTAQASKPLFALRGYALTSANDVPSRDPRDWRLLGSNDGGKSWAVLDVRRNEAFVNRFHRRVFVLTNNPPAYALYRFQVDSVRVPDGRPGGATCVQLAGLEPLYASAPSTGRFSVVVSARGENPPIEVADALFDGDAKTKWLDFAGEANTNKASWVEWQYLAGGGEAVMSMHRLQAALRGEPTSYKLRLEGVVACWNAPSRKLALLDESGFAWLELASDIPVVRPGERVRLVGEARFHSGNPVVLQPELTRLDAVPEVPEMKPGQSFGTQPSFVWTSVSGRVTAVSDDAAHNDLRLEADGGGGQILVRLLDSHLRLPAFPGCRLRFQGVLQAVLDGGDQRAAGILWVPDLEHVSLEDPTEVEWAHWPESSADSLWKTNPPLPGGRPIRVLGNVVRQEDGQTLACKGPNQFIVCAKDAPGLAPGAPIEAVGFYTKKGRVPTLLLARLRAAPEHPVAPVAQPAVAFDEQHPVTELKKVRELIETQPQAQFPVRVRGVITFIDLGLGTFFLQDGADGVRVSNQLGAGLGPMLQQEGLYVELVGEVTPYTSAITAQDSVKILGRGRLPEPLRHTLDYMLTGRDFSQWVEVEGIVRQVEGHRLTVFVNGGRLAVWINELDNASQERLLGSVVRVRGVCEPVVNNRNTILGLRLLVPSLECVEMLNPAPENPFSLRARPIHDVMRLGVERSAQTLQLVKTTGVVTYCAARVLFLQDGEEGLRVMLRSDAQLEPGDRVEVVGFAEPDGFSPRLVQALVQKTGHEALPPAVPIDVLDTELSSRDATRGQIEAVVLGSSVRKSQQVLELRDDQRARILSVFLPASQTSQVEIPAGSRVRLEGVFKAETETSPDYDQVTSSFSIFANSAADIVVLHRPSWWNTQHTLWMLGGLAGACLLSLGWIGSLRKQVQRRTRELHAEIAEHKRTEAHLEAEIAERKKMQFEIEKTHKELMTASRQAGMAEVATSVLHNVGNVLNSVNVSASLLAERFKHSKVANLAKAAALLRQHDDDLGGFLVNDPKGRQLPGYFTQLAEHLQGEQTAWVHELGELNKNIEHIKDIVAMQQSYSKVAGVVEPVNVRDLVEDALRMNAAALERHDVEIVREFEAKIPELLLDKHKILQVLVNLIRNAKYACDESNRFDKRLTLRLANGDGRIKISVIDNGVGIPPENLTRIFNHGFTTRKHGHGFGLHSGALAAQEMGGQLRAHSDGVGRGATFTLELPVTPTNLCSTPTNPRILASS